MFGNDYTWRIASEPLDDPTNQVDSVSLDAITLYSFGTRLGSQLHEATMQPVNLIASARGATSTVDWLPAADPFDRTTLFGSAAYRALTVAGETDDAVEWEGGPVTALVWYQGESDALAGTLERTAFRARTNTIMDAFVVQLDVPVLYVQLASHRQNGANASMQVVREYQRQLETGAQVEVGSGAPQPRERFHMVVAHDLPRNDDIHLSRSGQQALAERLALAYREHVLGEAVDGTGPRLVGITMPSTTTVRIETTRTVNDHPTYDGYFTVRDAGASPLTITAMARDPDDPTAVRLELNRAVEGELQIRYRPPANDDPEQDGARRWNAVHDPETGLPLPAFGTHGAN